MGSVCPEFNKKAISNILNKLAFDKDKKIPFEKFNFFLKKEIFGIVLTAHPTFGMTYEIMLKLAKLATDHNKNGKKIDDAELKLIIKEIFKTEQKPEKNISLILNIIFLSFPLKTFNYP